MKGKKVKNRTIPRKLYKYQPYNVQTLDNLKQRQLWFSNPIRFNDPFDYWISFDKSDLNDEEINAIYQKERQRYSNPEAFDKLFMENGKPNDEYKERIIDTAEHNTRMTIKKYRENAVACLSAKRSDILMWGHYADGHKGFCLEFDTNYIPFNYAREVIYSPAYPPFNPAQVILNGVPIALVTTKSKHWKYENEWRILGVHGEQGFVYEPAALTAVYFGAMMKAEHKEIIYSVLAKYPPEKFYEMRLSHSSYSLTREDYIIPRSAM